MMFKRYLLFVVFLGVAAGREDSPSAKTSSGTLKGKKITVLGKLLNVFLGVPYALPPIGDLRFKAPVAFTKEDDVLDVQKFAPICYQPPHAKSVINPLLKPNQSHMSEDCLYLNLYVPEKSGEREFPVMVWLSGEGFSYADPTQFDGSFLASTQKIIVVTVSYRVSLFGFLNGLSQDAPGNVGLWDQRLALKWVQKNIRAFGGNPAKVTLAGRFSGAMSTVIHAVSPLSKHETIFQRIILHSGVPDGKWVFNSNPLNAAMLLAEAMDCVFSNFSMTISCLKKVPAEVLIKAGNSMLNYWRPSLDFTLISESSLSESLEKCNSNIEILIGTNNNEGSLCLAALKVMNPTLYENILDNKLSEIDYEKLIESFLFDVYKDSNQLVNDLVSFTYGVRKSSQRDQFVDFCGDLYINSLSVMLEDILSTNKRKVFVFELNHRPSFSIQAPFIEAGHGDDVLYSFGLPLQMENLPEKEINLTRRILKAVSNFVYYGNPNAIGEPEWPPYSEGKMVRRFNNLQAVDVVKSSHVNAAYFWQTIIPNVFSNICSSAPMAAALVDTYGNKNNKLAYGHILGNWVSIPVAEYLIVGLLCTCVILVISVIIALVVILRHTPRTAFRRLK